MTNVTKLQVSQPLSIQTTPNQSKQVSFKGDSDCYEKTSKADVAAVTVAGAAAGAVGARTINGKLNNFLKHYSVDTNKDLTPEEKKQNHRALSDAREAAKNNYKEDLNAAKADKKESAKELKNAVKASNAQKDNAELKLVAEDAKKALDAAKQELKDMKAKVKLPVKYRAIAAAAGAVVIGGAYAIAKTLINKSSKEN
ncbi:MAG: hypothetical protein PHC34_10235 [Candidatus Gastranaerophilales bacterium]|nr:hypothetical protein [Candidatus Gastranaerophilales bacterium]